METAHKIALIQVEVTIACATLDINLNTIIEHAKILMSVLTPALIGVITYAKTRWGVMCAAAYWTLHWDRTK